MEQVFGKIGCGWLVPTQPVGRGTDGINYPISEDSIMGDLFNPLVL